MLSPGSTFTLEPNATNTLNDLGTVFLIPQKLEGTYRDSLNVEHKLEDVVLAKNSNMAFLRVPSYEAIESLTMTATLAAATWSNNDILPTGKHYNGGSFAPQRILLSPQTKHQQYRETTLIATKKTFLW